MRSEKHHRGMSTGYVINRLCIAAGALAAVVLMLLLFRQQRASPPPEAAYGDLDKRFVPTLTMEKDGKTHSYYDTYFTTILFIGVDDVNFSEQTNYRSGGQADFLFLVALDRRNRTITPIHIDRDTITPIRIISPFGNYNGTRATQICLSNAFGKTVYENTQNTMYAVSNLLGGIRINRYFVLDMEGITLLNDALGGVEVTLTEDFSHLDPSMTAGTTLRLQGKQAEYFVRTRYNVGDNTNAQRMSRQRVFLQQAAELLEQKTSEDIGFINTVLNKLGRHLYTNMNSSWLMDLTYELQHYQRKEITDLPGIHQIGSDGFVEFIPDQAALKALMIDIFYQ